MKNAFNFIVKAIFVNQTMKFGQLIEYNIRNNFLEKLNKKCSGEASPRQCSGEASPRPFKKNQN